MFAVALVDFGGHGGCNAMALEKEHDFAGILVFRERLFQLAGACLADPGNFCEPSGFLFEDSQRIGAESIDDPFGEIRTDSLEDAAGKIMDDAFGGRRLDAGDGSGLELETMDGMPHPMSGASNGFARPCDGAGALDDDHLLTVCGDLFKRHLCDQKSVLFVLVKDGLDGSLEGFCVRIAIGRRGFIHRSGSCSASVSRAPRMDLRSAGAIFTKRPRWPPLIQIQSNSKMEC